MHFFTIFLHLNLFFSCRPAAIFYGAISMDELLGIRQDKQNKYKIQTIAAHHDGEDWTEEELREIEQFKAFVRMKSQKQTPQGE